MSKLFAPYVMEQIKQGIAKSLMKFCGENNTLDKIISCLEYPKFDTHGDLCLPVRKLSLPTGTNPVQFAAEVSKSFPSDSLISSTSNVGIYVNFTLNKASLIRQSTEQVIGMNESFGTNNDGQGKTVIFDYSSPNIAKPFHAGHLRSTIIGNFLINAFKANGYKTVGINYLGDWGKQYGLLAVGFAKYGNEELLLQDPIKHLFDVYVRINQDAEQDATIHDRAREIFVRMEAGDEEVLKIWRRFRELSIVKYKELYTRLGISFDVFSGESFFEHSMKKYVDELKQTGILKESEKAFIVDLNEWGLGNSIVLKKDGTSTYMTRDIAAANERFNEYNFVKSIYVIAVQQDLHMQQLFRICHLMGRPWTDNMVHVNFGLVEGMSTRKGNVVFLEDIIDGAKEAMHDVMRKNESKYAQIQDPEGTADTLAISAIFIQDMSARRIKNYAFDMDRMTSFEGDTGPYLQYAHARLFSVQRNSSLSIEDSQQIKWDLLQEKIAFDLALHLAKYPAIIQDVIMNYEPCTLVNYLMSLSHLISQAFDVLWVMGQPEPVAKARLAVFVASRIVLGNGLRVLGLSPLERM